MAGHSCAQCGAFYRDANDSCADRFSALLALDHSRHEPWGSRHGSAFAAYTLQHPDGVSREGLERCWTLLYRIWIAGDDPQFVAQSLRQLDQGVMPRWTVAPLPADAATPQRPRITIADMELFRFRANAYPAQLENWCLATLESLGQPSKRA